MFSRGIPLNVPFVTHICFIIKSSNNYLPPTLVPQVFLSFSVEFDFLGFSTSSLFQSAETIFRITQTLT